MEYLPIQRVQRMIKFFFKSKPLKIINKFIFITGILCCSYPTYAVESQPNGNVATPSANTDIPNLPIANAEAVEGTERTIDLLKSDYISPYNYSQDPIAFNMSLSSVTKSPCGTYHIGLSSINSVNFFLKNGTSRAAFVNSFEAWGQTARYAGFALGGGVTGAYAIVQDRPTDQFSNQSVLSPTLAYLNYEYKNILEVVAGNILLATPWVNSISSYPGASFANQNNTYQGVTFNLQISPILFLSGFRAFTYLQYPNSWFNNKNLYNTFGGPLENRKNGTPGSDGLGLEWYPDDHEDLNLWYYQFLDFADMWYLDNTYNFKLPCKNSIDLGLQALTQYSNGNAVTATTLIPGSTTQFLGPLHGNAVGIKLAFNAPHNTLMVGYNSVFGTGNSYLRGGIVTPYTFGLETDPLYTTPALSSLAEFGSGNAYIVKYSMSFFDDALKTNLSFSQFFVKKVFNSQPNKVTEYDAGFSYTFPQCKNLILWSRLVFLQLPQYAGGDILQPRLIINYVF